ncbi:ATP-dependent RecD-like DNA helicase [Oscillospiraceae bacterium MB08-C2-2]|nr:ATP-dependent RecD-like DNA helicase [Oscillospiraceae bacterium MB08-C2-2]
MEPKLEKITGTVEEIIFTNEENGFTVCLLSDGREMITVVGEMPGVAAGEQLTVTGRYTAHPTYGTRFKAELYERELPATSAAILKYLSSGSIKGIGPAMARRIVDAFGLDSLRILEQDPERLSTIKGITLKKAQEISQEYKHLFGIRSVMVSLAQYGLEPSIAIKAWKQWGTMAVDIIQENPYELCCEAVGLGFEQADDLAITLGTQPESGRRIQAGLEHVLRHNLTNGHTCLPLDKLIATAVHLLEVPDYLVEEAVERSSEDNSLITDTLEGKRFVYLPELYEAETYAAGRIGMMLITAGPPGKKTYENQLNLLEEKLGIHYARLQRQAVQMALQNPAFILTGGPGTGKTTTLNAIITLLEEAGEKVALAAPTGRAAKRMSEVTGREAKTIHRLLEVDFRDQEGKSQFKRNEKNPLRHDAIILDEVSMVDTLLFASLLKAMRLSCRLILVGDPDQLPSVGAGNILRDLIASDTIPTVHLDEIFRQAQKSVIVENAHSIVRGEMPNLAARDADFFFLARSSYDQSAQTVVELCASRLPKAYGFSPADIQVVVPSRVGGLGTVELNRLLQRQLNPHDPLKGEQLFGSTLFREQDKVMQVRNNYDIPWKRDDGEEGAGIFNGDIGSIELVDRPSQTLLIRFEDRVATYSFEMAHELEHAWAITVHKSQGSEFEAVVMPLMSYHPRLYYRNILYTAVSRAKKIMVLLGQAQTVEKMVANHKKVLRYTNLASFLQESAFNSAHALSEEL